MWSNIYVHSGIESHVRDRRSSPYGSMGIRKWVLVQWKWFIPGAARAWGLTVEGCTASEPQRIVDALADGKLVVAIMTKGHFTSSGHFIVLRGVTSDGKILVADPASYRRSEKEWDIKIILNEASKLSGSGGPFWIISR